MCGRLDGEVEVHEEGGAAAPWLQRGRKETARAELPAPKGSRKQLGMFLLNPISKSLQVFILLSNNNISNNNMTKIK